MYVEWGTIMKMLPLSSNNVKFSTIPQFPFRGGWGGLTKNDYEFPSLRIVEFFERSLIQRKPNYSVLFSKLI